MRTKDYGKFKFLKSIDDYKKELIDLHKEVGISIATDTLIVSDLDLMRRCEVNILMASR